MKSGSGAEMRLDLTPAARLREGDLVFGYIDPFESDPDAAVIPLKDAMTVEKIIRSDPPPGGVVNYVVYLESDYYLGPFWPTDLILVIRDF